METVAQALAAAGARLIEGINNLLGPNRRLRDNNDRQSMVTIIGPTRYFDDLSLDQKRLQSQLNEQLTHFFDLARALLRNQPGADKNLTEWHDRVGAIVGQSHGVWYDTTDEARAAVAKAVQQVAEAVGHLHDPLDSSLLLVPDTNALIHGRDLDGWESPSFPEFAIVLVPMVLSELDDLKTRNRDPKIQQRAREVIRRIKRYRDLGSLSEGVPIVPGRSRLLAAATEPRVPETLPWLDAMVPDDRFIASVIEVMRRHSRSAVVLVTRDINMQNKAAFARLPFLEDIAFPYDGA